jgi:hypothetical protein
MSYEILDYLILPLNMFLNIYIEDFSITIRRLSHRQPSYKIHIILLISVIFQ